MYKGTLAEIELQGMIKQLQQKIKDLEYAIACIKKAGSTYVETDPVFNTWLSANPLSTVAFTGNSDDLTEGTEQLLLTQEERDIIAGLSGNIIDESLIIAYATAL